MIDRASFDIVVNKTIAQAECIENLAVSLGWSGLVITVIAYNCMYVKFPSKPTSNMLGFVEALQFVLDQGIKE